MPLTAQLKRDTGNTITLPLLCVAQSKTKCAHTDFKMSTFQEFTNFIDENQYDEESALWQPGDGAGMKVWPRDAGQRFA